MLSYQGRLTDSLGNPVADTTHNLTFRLYNVPSGGSAFWSEIQTVRTRAGLFSVLPGWVTPIGRIPDAGELYLAMAIEHGPELTPRLRIVSAAYAYKADTANYALAAGTSGSESWVRGMPDSVLFTVKPLGIARGGASNMLHGSSRHSHTNLGVACTTGMVGQDNTCCTVGGGFSNVASDDYATVAGGGGNHASSSYAAVGGGSGNTATGSRATVAGGRANAASNTNATVAGGKFNVAAGYCSAVGGGVDNAASDIYSTVGGGSGNTASGGRATVSGGFSNTASGFCAAVAGGFVNTASGEGAAVAGGSGNCARGGVSLAAGSYARANHPGSFVWSDSAASDAESVYTGGNNQFRVRARGGAWFFSNAGMTTGAVLAAGSNSWASVCDSANKEDFRAVDRRELLEKVASLRVRDYKMTDQDDGTRHIGPVAQDFHAAFGFGESNTNINLADADGVVLAAIQALYEQNQILSRRVAELEAKLEDR